MMQKPEPRTMDLKLTKIKQLDTGQGMCACVQCVYTVTDFKVNEFLISFIYTRYLHIGTSVAHVSFKVNKTSYY